ncbi:MAG: type II toxin-antitoxin system Phd/YefM family antitoxin [Magnetococcales bacterium]|nr:type II toxin-antitoxin system Phd/YefM family antitoxin [Magnetococcales bacterium]
MSQYTIHAAKTHLSRIINQALTGEEVIIARGKNPLVKLVPITPLPEGRAFGTLKHTGSVDERFFDPLPEEELAAWEGE